MSQMSRRDWFRLRRPRTNQMLSEPSIEQDSQGLKQVELPPNHGDEDLSQLPPLREATLSNDQIESLFGDIDQFASDIQLMQRSAQRRAPAGTEIQSSEQLAAAKEALLGGQISKLQIRYRWKDADWIDTIDRQQTGFRLIRIAHHS